MEQSFMLPFRILALHIRLLVQEPATLLRILLPIKELGKAVNDSPNDWDPYHSSGIQCGIPGSWGSESEGRKSLSLSL